MYLNELQARAYFVRERDLDRAIEKRRLAHERKTSAAVVRPRRTFASRSRRAG